MRMLIPPQRKSRFRKPGLIVLVVILGIVVLAVVFFLWTARRWGRFVVSTLEFAVHSIAGHSGISLNLLYAIVILATIPFFWAVAKYMHGLWFWVQGVGPSLRLYRSTPGMIIVGYVGLYFLAVYFVSRAVLFDKYCSDTPEGIKVFDALVRDPIYGIQSKPCTFEQIEEIRSSENKLASPRRIPLEDPQKFEFFDAITGKPRVWYYQSPNGEYEVFDRAGKYPGTGELLRPIDANVRQAIIHLYLSKEADGRLRNREASDSKYVNLSVVKRPGRKQVAVLVISTGQDRLGDVEDGLGHALSNRGLTPVGSFFKPPFVQEGRAQRLFEGVWDEATQLGISNHVDLVIMGNATVNETTAAELDGLISTTLHLELKCLNVSAQSVCGSGSLNVVGAGFTKEASLKNASEKARPEIDEFVRAMHSE